MKIADLHLARLYQLNEQGKGPFLRQTKHFEETSELAEAVYENHTPAKIAGEAIDGLLMLLSIAADYVGQDVFPPQLLEAVDLDNAAFVDSTVEHIQLQRIGLGFAALSYIGSLQHITTAVQKYEGVASSAYKGEASSLSILLAIIESTSRLSSVLAYTMLMDLDLNLQEIYTAKMDKWEKVSK